MKKSALFGFLLLAAPHLSAQTPAPQPTPFPQPSPTPQSTPQNTPVPNGTPAPTATPGVGPTPIAGTLPVATGTPAATPAPTSTPAPKTIEDLTKGYDKIEGVLTIYRKTENNRQRLLAEVRDDQIGPLWMLQSTFASGAVGRVTTGRPARDLLFRFQKTPDERLILATPNIWYRSQDPNLERAIERDFPDAYLRAFTPLARDKDKGRTLIDLSGVFDGSVTGLNTLLEPQGLARQFLDTYALDPELSFLEQVRNFPTNLVVESNFNYKRIARAEASAPQTLADPRTLPIRVTFNVYPLPQNNGYRPRLADPRVGYFINGQLQTGRTGFELFDYTRKDPRVVYINRWNLQKSPDGTPQKPIVFTLDNSVPQRFRRAMREGILTWNSAFERLGFKNAIQVRETLPDDYNSSDMRFNSLRFVASPPTGGGAYAVALLRENPLTGEIINASITVDSNFTRAAFREKEDVVDPLAAKNSAEHAGMACELEQAPDPRFLDDDKYIEDYLRATVAHEMGHILGLRHNFLASTFLTPQDLASPAKTRAEGTSASVMDYVGFNVFGLKTGAQLFSKEPGRYDLWAVEYGYSDFLPALENEGLKRIAARANQPGLAYYGDETADDYDPTVVRYDLSSDPLAYVEKSLGVTSELLRNLEKNEVKPGDSYARFTRRLRGLLRSRGRDAEIAARYIGGAKVRRVVKGDKAANAKTQNQPFSLVSLVQQKRAMAILSREIFALGAFKVPASYLQKTAPDPFDFNDPGADSAFPIRDDIARVQGAILESLFENARLKRLENAGWKFKNSYTLENLFPDTTRAIWGALTPKTSFDSLQRELCLRHLTILVGFYIDERAGAPDDAQLLAGAQLRELKARLTPLQKSSPDALSRLFFADAVRRINAALAKKPYGD